jgi:hypothetical protein
MNKKLLFGLIIIGITCCAFSNTSRANWVDPVITSENITTVPGCINESDISPNLSKQNKTVVYSFTLCELETELVPIPITQGCPTTLNQLFFRNTFEYDGKMYAQLIPKNGTFDNISDICIYLDGVPDMTIIPHSVREIPLYTSGTGSTGKVYVHNISALSDYAPLIKYRYKGTCKEIVELPKYVIEHRKLEFEIITTIEPN